jgi:hypothetical protein
MSRLGGLPWSDDQRSDESEVFVDVEHPPATALIDEVETLESPTKSKTLAFRVWDENRYVWRFIAHI